MEALRGALSELGAAAAVLTRAADEAAEVDDAMEEAAVVSMAAADELTLTG